MTGDQADQGGRNPDHEAEWERSERASFWIALAIALVPIPIALLVSLAMGSPPWRAKPAADHPRAGSAPVEPVGQGEPAGHGAR